MLALIVFLGMIGILVCIAFARAWVFSYMWAWFFVPLGAPKIGVAMAMGIALTVSLLTAHVDPNKAPEGESLQRFGRIVGFGILGPLLLLGIGAIIHAVIS